MGDNIVEIIIRAIDQASGVIDKIGKSGGDLEHKLVANWKAIGVAAAAAGAGIELLARKNNELLKETQQISIATGLSSKEINQLARDVAGAGDTIGETLDLIKLAGKEGLQSGEAIKKYAEYWDMVGDASGEVAGDLADASSGLRLFGIEADNVSDSADAFGHILNNTKTSLSDFLGILSKAGPSVSRFDIDINQMAIIVDELEEVGFTGKKAISAINDAAAGARNLPEFIANLERLTGAEINLNQSLDGSAEKLYAQAEAVDANLTPVQKLTAAWNEFAYQNAETIKTMSSLVPALASLGPALKSLKEVQGLLKDVNIASKLSGLSLAGMGTSALGLVGTLGLLGVALAPILAIMIATDYQEQKNAETIQKLTEVEKEQLYTMGEMSRGVTDLGGNYSEFGTLMVDTNEQILESYDEFGNVQRETGEQILELYDEFGRVIPENAEKVKQAYTEFGTPIEQVAEDVETSVSRQKQAFDELVQALQAAGVSTQQAAEIASAAFPQIATSAEGMSGRTAAALKAVESALNDGVITAGQAEAMYKAIFENIGNAAGNMAAKIQEFVRDTKGGWQGLQEIYTIQGKNAGEGVYYWWNEKTGIWEQMVPADDGQGYVPFGSDVGKNGGSGGYTPTGGVFTEQEWRDMDANERASITNSDAIYQVGDQTFYHGYSTDTMEDKYTSWVEGTGYSSGSEGATGGAGGKGSTGGESSPSGYTSYDPNANAPDGMTWVDDGEGGYYSYAAGGGRIKKGGKVTVGEEGPEVYQKPDGTFILVGKDGKEEIVVEEGGKILPLLPGKSWQAFEEKSRSGTGEGSAQMDPLMESIDVHQKMRDSISEETETARTRLDSIDELIEATLKQHKQNADLTGSLFGSSDATKAHGSSLMDLIRKYQETDGAVGDSQKNLDHWNTSVVGNTEKMSKETLGSVEGMSSGVRAGAGRTTRDISETWNQIGKDSEEGTAGLGNDWKSFLQSARRDLQTEVQARSGPGRGFTGGGTGDGTGTGLEPVYDLEELWRRRGLPRAARGAKIVGAGDILVGEERPEVVRLPQGASVHPLSEYDGGFGGRAGNVYQITINTQGVIGDKSTARQFARWIMEALDFETIRRGTVA